MRTGGTLRRGQGVVGQVWESASARRMTDLPGSGTARAPAAAAAGLRTIVAVPVRNGTDVVGVLAVFSRRVVPPTPR